MSLQRHFGVTTASRVKSPLQGKGHTVCGVQSQELAPLRHAATSALTRYAQCEFCRS